MDLLVKYGKRVTLDDLAEARRFTAKLRQEEPDLFALAPQARASDEPRVYTSADEAIEERWREVRWGIASLGSAASHAKGTRRRDSRWLLILSYSLRCASEFP
jgi:hypothetical protein